MSNRYKHIMPTIRTEQH